MHILSGVIAFLLVLVTIALIGLILVQRGKGGGLAGVFGGGGVEQAFGTKATSLAQKATWVLGTLFLVFAIMLGKFWSPTSATAHTPPAEEKAPAELPAAPEKGAK